MSRDALRRVVAYCGAVLLCALVLQRYYAAGAPFFRAPETVLDHVWEGHHPQRNELVVVPQLAPLIPRGAQVTVLQPQNGKVWDDHLTFLTAVGLLPHHVVMHPAGAYPDRKHADLIEYVIAVDSPLNHPGYEEIAAVKNGWLYRRR